MLVRPRLTAMLVVAVIGGALASLPLAPVHVRAATTVGGTYHPLTPSRIVDTRLGNGAPKAPLGVGGSINVAVLNQGGVPSSGVAAAVLNVTVTDTTAFSYLTIYPTGVTRPVASNLNWAPGATVPNLVTVALGTGGAVTVFNGFGSVDVIVDVEGYYTDDVSSPGPDGLFNPLTPARLLDTRTGNGAPLAMMTQGQTIDLQVGGRGNVPATGAEAVVLNVTVTNPTTAGYLTVYPTGVSSRPLASNLNFVANQTVPNRVTVALGTSGKVSIYNGLGSTHVIADVNGWYTDGSIGGTGSRFTPVTPARILDSRNGTGGFAAPWGPNTSHAMTVAGQGGVPLMTDPNPPTAVVANVTVTDTTAASALTGWPDGAAEPLASDLNWVPGLTVPNLAVMQVGTTGKVDMYNLYGCVDVIVDVVGWFTGPPATITPGTPPPASLCPIAGTWLQRFNYWRATAGLPPLTENTTWSAGDYAHSVYMVKNQLITHYETPGLPYYSLAGDTAARNGNIEVSSSTSFSDDSAIDWWMGAPFHAMGMMDPRLTSTGFGAYREVRSGWQAGFSLDVLRGNSFTGGTYPVYWPGNGITVPLRQYSGNEFPDPLQACPGYAVPTGLPVFVQIGGNVATTVTASAFTGNGAPLPFCVIGSSTNSTLAPYLTPRGGVIVIPRNPLSPGVLYAVALTVNGAPYAWTFEVS